MIRAVNVSLQYLDHGNAIHACRDINLEIQSGKFVGILGPSGSGKSSLLYLLSGLKTPTSGHIEIDGKDLASLEEKDRANLRLKRFGFVFQVPYLLGYLSALENVIVARPDLDRRTEAMEILARLDMAKQAHRLPHELSGGERQRVCVARALLGEPEVIFADEPTASLDHQNGSAVVALLNEHRGSGSLVMVTHDQSMLAQADEIVHIADGEIVP